MLQWAYQLPLEDCPMSKSDNLGDRMKRYEHTTKISLMRRTPVIIRIDGRAFHTFTKKFKTFDSSEQTSPFGDVMHSIMVETAKQLVTSIQNACVGYVQSDEISILLRDWDRHTTEQWFDGGVQKITSVAASIATATFNMQFNQYCKQMQYSDLAQFDARVFNLPKEEVTNYFIWRQQDASRNSVQMLGHFHFSQKQLHGKNNSQVQDMLMLHKQINWNDLNTWKKRGACVVDNGIGIFVDHNIPIFTADRHYIEQFLTVPASDDDQ